jgi:hypothetical protein
MNISINIENNYHSCQAWWYTLGISAIRWLRQEDQKFKASLGYKAKPSSQEKKNYHPSWIQIVFTRKLLLGK